MAMFQGDTHMPLASERVVVEAPFSLAGSTKRLLGATANWNDVIRLVVLIVVFPIVWALVIIWYVLWGIWLVPYRLLRRGSRKRKRQALQHREMLTQMQYQAISTQAALAHQAEAMGSPPAAPPVPPSKTGGVLSD